MIYRRIDSVMTTYIWITRANSHGWATIYGPLTRYVKLWVAHAPGMPGTFSLPTQVSDPDTHHGTCVTHVSWCMPGSLTSGFPLKSVAGKSFPAFPAHALPQFHVSGKRPMVGEGRARRNDLLYQYEGLDDKKLGIRWKSNCSRKLRTPTLFSAIFLQFLVPADFDKRGNS